MGPPRRAPSRRGFRHCMLCLTMTTAPDQAPFVERRLRFAAALGDALAVVPGGQEVGRNGDVSYEFRQTSDFFFLTGVGEPDAVAVFNPADPKERYVLFVRPRDRELETWNGARAGVEGAIAAYGADAAYPIDQLEARLREYALDRPTLYYRLGTPAFDGRILRLVGELRAARVRGPAAPPRTADPAPLLPRPRGRRGPPAFAGRILRLVGELRAARVRGHAAPVRIEDPGPLLHELRLRRAPAELARQRRACEISRDAHVEAMRYARPGLFEYQVQAALKWVFRVQGSPRNGYPSIVASGPNACILHYTENTRRLEDGDLLLIDAGCAI